MYKVLVCGGRIFGLSLNERCFVYDTLDCIKEELKNITIIEGGAKGADTCAKEWAEMNILPYKEYPANWNLHGKSAGYLRNKQMLDEENPNLIIAFPGGKGTENMVTQAKQRGIEVRRIDYNAKT